MKLQRTTSSENMKSVEKMRAEKAKIEGKVNQVTGKKNVLEGKVILLLYNIFQYRFHN